MLRESAASLVRRPGMAAVWDPMPTPQQGMRHGRWRRVIQHEFLGHEYIAAIVQSCLDAEGSPQFDNPLYRCFTRRFGHNSTKKAIQVLQQAQRLTA